LLDGVCVISGQAERVDETAWNGELYKAIERKTQSVSIKAISYYAWCNRQPGEMLVWITEK
jgi:DUF1680 family protein